MDHYPQWHHVFFPTLMRCEKTHFWGYFMSPLGRIITLTSADPVASYHLHYNNDRQLHSFGHATVSVPYRSICSIRRPCPRAILPFTG